MRITMLNNLSMATLAWVVSGCVINVAAAEGPAVSGNNVDFSTDFEVSDEGSFPKGWSIALTGSGMGDNWKIVEDSTSSGGSKVLAQTVDNPGSVFNLCVADEPRFTDVEVSVRFKSLRGRIDQGGGVVWRYQDANNYYIARFNPLEDNYRFYKVEDGRRRQLSTKEKLKAPAGQWHTLSIRMKGDAVICLLNGKVYLEAKENTFDKAGRVGLWTKADAQTSFDNFQARALAK